jgi:hypothetical protein
LEEAGAEDAFTLTRIESQSAAEQERFLGSPTVRVDGEDVEPAAAERSDFGMKCRLYGTESGLEHLPPDDWTRAALRRSRPDV